MDKPLRLLLVDASAEGADSIRRPLSAGGLEASLEAAPTKEDLARALSREEPWDALLSEPKTLGAEEAIALLREREIDAPLIVVAKEPREEEAVEALRAGARDYLGPDQ